MSISPTDAHRSEKLLSRALPRNPNSGHGYRHHPRRPPAGYSGGAARRGGRSAVAASSGAVLGSDRTDPGEAVAVAEDSGHYACDGVANSATVFHSGPIGRGRVSSQIKPDLAVPAQGDGNYSGSGSYFQSFRIAGSQGNSTQSAARRNHSVNANHLLNFHYDPISRPQARVPPPPPRRQRKIKPYNKDLFLQANFKFIVLDCGSCSTEMMDPDKMLQWEDVICVKYSTPSPVQCPICLESPLCPQITTCGHIYCFPCILQYLLMGEEDHKGECWKKCPLCFMMISTKDLYTIFIKNVQQLNVGDHASFMLLTRPKDSLVPSLKNQQEADLLSDTSNNLRDTFSKFVLTSDVELSVREAKLDLSHWLVKADSGLVDDLERLPYVCVALEQLENRMKKWAEHQKLSISPKGNASYLQSNVEAAHTAAKTLPGVMNSYVKTYNTISDALEPKVRVTQSDQKHDETMSDKGAADDLAPFLGGSVEEKGSYTYYQAIDGQHLILHPINMKCLLHHYGSYDMLPPRISGVVLELETITQSEAMRRRYRYLSHFSLTTTFQLCEIDLSVILPPESLAPFMDEIKKRAKQRKQLAKKERIERAKAEAAALNSIPVPSDGFRSSRNDVSFSPDDFEALGSGVPSTSPPITSERRLFSNVARLGFAAGHDSPSLKAGGSSDSPGNTQGTSETSRAQDSRREPQRTAVGPIGKKGKKPAKVLLSTAGGRRY